MAPRRMAEALSGPSPLRIPSAQHQGPQHDDMCSGAGGSSGMCLTNPFVSPPQAARPLPTHGHLARRLVLRPGLPPLGFLQGDPVCKWRGPSMPQAQYL